MVIPLQRKSVPEDEYFTFMTLRQSFEKNKFRSYPIVFASYYSDMMSLHSKCHKSVKDFYKYIRITPEEAGNKIKELWIKRGEMAVLEK